MALIVLVEHFSIILYCNSDSSRITARSPYILKKVVVKILQLGYWYSVKKIILKISDCPWRKSLGSVLLRFQNVTKIYDRTFDSPWLEIESEVLVLWEIWEIIIVQILLPKKWIKIRKDNSKGFQSFLTKILKIFLRGAKYFVLESLEN